LYQQGDPRPVILVDLLGSTLVHAEIINYSVLSYNMLNSNALLNIYQKLCYTFQIRQSTSCRPVIMDLHLLRALPEWFGVTRAVALKRTSQEYKVEQEKNEEHAAEEAKRLVLDTVTRAQIEAVPGV
jgi:hypothetical protein